MNLTAREIEEKESEEKDKKCVLFFSDYEKLEKENAELKNKISKLEYQNEKIKKAILMIIDESIGATNKTYWEIYGLLDLGKLDNFEEEIND